jgi:HEAT repeat protein
MPRNPNVEELHEDKDLKGLMDALRYPGSPIVRAQAAQALGQLNNSLAVESLIRSTRLDPAADVQAAARQALGEMFGTNAQNVIQAYPIYPDEAPWIVETTANAPEDDGDFEDDEDADEQPGEEYEDQDERDQDEQGSETGDEGEGGWNADDLGPLVTILRSERDPRLRLRAARALGKLGATNIHAVEALAATALWGERPSIRAAAVQALVKIYGDEETDRLLETFRELKSGQPDSQAALEADQDEEAIEEEPENEAAAQRTRQAQTLPHPIPYTQHEPVMHDEGAGHLRQIVWIGIILLIVLGLVVVFTYFK